MREEGSGRCMGDNGSICYCGTIEEGGEDGKGGETEVRGDRRKIGGGE